MTRQEKDQVIADLEQKLRDNDNFYIADTAGLSVAEVNELRGLCFDKGITMQVAKNTLLLKALEKAEKNYDDLLASLQGPTAIFFAEVAKAPAQVMKEYRKKSEKPILKAACIETAVYVGDEQIEALSTIKSKEELVADVIALLQSPAKNVVSALNSGKNTLGGLLKALEEKAAA